MPTVTPGARTSARSACATSCRGADEDEIPDQRQPRRRQREAPMRVSCFEQALAVFADGMPLAAVANTKHPEELCVTPGAPAQEAIAGHARWGFRNARLERA